MNIFVILFVIFVCFDGVVHGQGFGQLIKSIGLMRTIYERCGVSQSTFCTNGGRPVAFPMFEDSCPKNGDKYGPRPGHLEIPNFQDLFNERGSPCVNDVLVDVSIIALLKSKLQIFCDGIVLYFRKNLENFA
jgi:hypothetical protein